MKTFVVAKVLVINEAGELLVLRRSQTDERRPGQWDLPGGWVDEGEDMRAAAKRETIEETGIALDECRLVFALTEVVDKGSGTWLVFLARTSGRPEVTLSDEHDYFAWMPFEEAVDQFTYPRQRRMLEYVRDHRLLEEHDTNA
jgi:8-oxo-dGTP pyrophosphatase MutT (NUDIX family)